MKLIDRKDYLQRLLAVKNVPDIKVITGIRRCGKSKLMDAFSEIVAKEDNANIVRINLNQKKYEKLLNPDALYEYMLLTAPFVRNQSVSVVRKLSVCMPTPFPKSA